MKLQVLDLIDNIFSCPYVIYTYLNDMESYDQKHFDIYDTAGPKSQTVRFS